MIKIQLSDKRGDAILLVAAEGDAEGVELLEDGFARAAGLVGLGSAYESFGAPAPAAVPAATALTRSGPPPVPAAAQRQPEPWEQPQQQPAQDPSVPSCQHGPKTYKSGTTNGRAWAFWGCNGRSDDPTKCEKQWVR
jgi:hypothetical protein